MRPGSGQLPSLEEVYVTPVPEKLPHDFPSLLRPPFRGSVSINGKLLAIFIMRTAPASTPYGKSSPRRKEHKSSHHRPSPTSSHIHRFLFIFLFRGMRCLLYIILLNFLLARVWRKQMSKQSYYIRTFFFSLFCCFVCTISEWYNTPIKQHTFSFVTKICEMGNGGCACICTNV